MSEGGETERVVREARQRELFEGGETGRVV